MFASFLLLPVRSHTTTPSSFSSFQHHHIICHTPNTMRICIHIYDACTNAHARKGPACSAPSFSCFFVSHWLFVLVIQYINLVQDIQIQHSLMLLNGVCCFTCCDFTQLKTWFVLVHYIFTCKQQYNSMCLVACISSHMVTTTSLHTGNFNSSPPSPQPHNYSHRINRPRSPLSLLPTQGPVKR